MSASPAQNTPSLKAAIGLYAAYLAIFFSVWIVNGVDYLRIGESAETVRLWYALPTVLGSSFLILAISLMGWWRTVLFDEKRSGPRWLWILPAMMLGLIVNNFIHVDPSKLSGELLLWCFLGAVGVGFGEEVITRGALLAGFRQHVSETRAWLFCTLMFSALHIPNALFGLPWQAMPVQVVMTFIMGSALYIARRLSGTLLLPIALHGLWDSSLFLGMAAGGQQSPWQWLLYPLAIVGIVVLLRHQRRETTAH